MLRNEPFVHMVGGEGVWGAGVWGAGGRCRISVGPTNLCAVGFSVGSERNSTIFFLCEWGTCEKSVTQSMNDLDKIYEMLISLMSRFGRM